MLHKSYVFSNEDWFKKLNWTNRNYECERNLDHIPQSTLDAILAQKNELENIIQKRTEALSCLNDARLIFHQFQEVATKINNLRNQSKVVDDYINEICKKTQEDNSLCFNLKEWLANCEEATSQMDCCFYQSEDDKSEGAWLQKSKSLLEEYYQFHLALQEALSLEFVLFYAPQKYYKTLVKLIRKELSASMNHTVQLDEFKKYVNTTASIDCSQILDLLENSRHTVKYMLDIFKLAEKQMVSDPRIFDDLHEILKTGKAPIKGK